MKIWTIVSIAEVIVYIGVSLFLFLRIYDGAGAINTFEVKVISFAIWSMINLCVFLVQFVWYKKIHKNKHLK